jgi:hypothetical protein
MYYWVPARSEVVCHTQSIAPRPSKGIALHLSLGWYPESATLTGQFDLVGSNKTTGKRAIALDSPLQAKMDHSSGEQKLAIQQRTGSRSPYGPYTALGPVGIVSFSIETLGYPQE